MHFTDQLNNTITLEKTPERIISLVPSQTELLHYLGLGDKVVGITKFCVHPEEWYKNKPRVGGTKNYHIDKIRELNPDLIIGNKEENEKAGIEELANEFPVWMSDIANLEEALEMISRVAELVGKQKKGDALIETIQNNFKNLQPIPQNKTVAYLIWNNPIMVAANGTFITEMLHTCGLTNVFSKKDRYAEVTETELSTSNPDFLFLSSEPFPFAEKHIAHYQKLLPTTKIILVDGEMFSWYGSRLQLASTYFKKLLKEIRF